MNKKTVSGIVVTLLLVGTLVLAFNIQPVRAIGTIYIRPDGSVDPTTAPIQRDGEIYTLTGNIIIDVGETNGLVVQRENIVVDGAHYFIGSDSLSGSGAGVVVHEIDNVTIKNVRSNAWVYGILLHGASDNSIIGNEITWNTIGINIRYSSNSNRIIGNKITDYNGDGIRLSFSCSDNIISENNITNNDYGVNLLECSNNIICKNDITNNWVGTDPVDSPNNIYYHNNFINNIHQARGYASVNTWDDGYPSGGNYWSDYTGVDEFRGINQDETGSDGFGDTPYVIDENNQDHYPLINPWTPPPPAPDFSVSVSPHFQTIAPGKSVTYTVTVASINGFSSEVSLSNAINPSSKRISAEFDPPSVTPPPDGSAKSTLTISTSKHAKSGFYGITVSGSSEGETHSTKVTLAIALYELFFEIDYMENHKPMGSVLTYIRNYYIKEHICITFIVDDEIPEDSSVTEDEFWAIERAYNKRGDDWTSSKETGVYDSKWKWVLFGTVYEEGPLWNGFCFVPEYGGIWIPGLSDRFGNYIFIADERNEEYASQMSGAGVTPEEVEKVSLMHEMGHSIGILKLVFNLDWPPWPPFVEGYDKDRKSVMSEMNPESCNVDPIHYSRKYWSYRNMEYYTI